MLKKLRERLYDRKIKKNLENMEFDTFAYYSDSIVPAFISEAKAKGAIHTVFCPKTEKSFKLAFSKLKKRYFKKFPYATAKENVKTYCNNFNFGEETANYCLEMFKVRSEHFKNEKTNDVQS